MLKPYFPLSSLVWGYFWVLMDTPCLDLESLWVAHPGSPLGHECWNCPLSKGWSGPPCTTVRSDQHETGWPGNKVATQTSPLLAVIRGICAPPTWYDISLFLSVKSERVNVKVQCGSWALCCGGSEGGGLKEPALLLPSGCLCYMLLSSRGFFANHSKCHALIALVGPGPEAWGCCRPILCPCPPFGSVSCGLSEEGLRWKYSHCSVGCGWDDFPQKGTVGKQMTCPWRLSISFPFLPFLSPERAVWRSWPEWQPCSDFCSSPQCHVHSEDCRHHQRGSRAFQWPSENVHPCTRWEPGSLSADRMSVPTMYRWREWPVGWVSGLRA